MKINKKLCLSIIAVLGFTSFAFKALGDQPYSFGIDVTGMQTADNNAKLPVYFNFSGPGYVGVKSALTYTNSITYSHVDARVTETGDTNVQVTFQDANGKNFTSNMVTISSKYVTCFKNEHKSQPVGIGLSLFYFPITNTLTARSFGSECPLS